MSKTEAMDKKIKGSRKFQKKVRALRAAHPGIGHKEASSLVKDGWKPGDQIPGFTNVPQFIDDDEPEAKGEKNGHGRLVLFVSGETFRLCSLTNGKKEIKIKDVKYDVVRL